MPIPSDSYDPPSYAYDANGNRLSATTASGTTSGSYDAQDRLLAYGDAQLHVHRQWGAASKTDTAAGQTTSYDYDTLGNLVA